MSCTTDGSLVCNDVNVIEGFVLIRNTKISKKRVSNDQTVNENGRELLSMCKNTYLFIVIDVLVIHQMIVTHATLCNSRSINSRSLTSDHDMLSCVTMFRVSPETSLSDQCYMCNFYRGRKICRSQRSGQALSVYRWNDNDQEQYAKAINDSTGIS